MYLRELKIKNFRKIEDITVSFPRGLCIIVGENNAGKTAIIDALRLMLIPSRDLDALRINEDDFRAGTDYTPIEISCTFSEPADEDEVNFQECLVDIGNGKFDIRMNARIEYNKTARRTNIKTWGGEVEGGSLPSTIYDHLASIYLKPLRDPENGLRPGRYSQVSRLIDSLTPESEHENFESVVSNANDEIKKLQSIETAKKDINNQMTSITGDELSQKTELIFSDPSFHRIIAGLQPEIEGLPFSLNGLGYNNLVFTSTTLGTLRHSPQYSFRSILIEEPEAHLHPQLQVLLLRHLTKLSAEDGKSKLQVITSSHSPILASQAELDSIVSVHENNGQTIAVSICNIPMDSKLKKKLERFLDATRGELFFARRILMVEGIAEAILLPSLTKIAGGNLKKSAVTVLNVDGLNFNAFLPLFEGAGFTLPIAILTDGDAKIIGGQPSATTDALKVKEATIPTLKVEYSSITFEHELARSTEILPLMLQAFDELHPILGKKLRETINELADADEKANAFLDKFLESKASKGQFAQELAALLENAALQQDAVPKYILEALKHLAVIK